jgi:hypothetical protein
VLIAAASLWAVYDLTRPPTGKLREFDPAAVAHVETAMWRSYYDGRRVALFAQLAELMRSQYQAAWLRSYVAAFRAASAAFVFKEGRNPGEYERALPNLEKFYRSLLPPGVNSSRAARLELEWWIAHRERATQPTERLTEALANLQAAIYDMPATAFVEHARLRAQAMLLRDRKAANGGVAEEDWREINRLLHRSWTLVRQAVSVKVSLVHGSRDSGVRRSIRRASSEYVDSVESGHDDSARLRLQRAAAGMAHNSRRE